MLNWESYSSVPNQLLDSLVSNSFAEFHSNGVTADQDKIGKIENAGRPATTEEIWSLLMACQFNAKFTFNNKANISYEDSTAPLRMLLKKDQKFKWKKEEEDVYQLLMGILEDPATL